MTDVRRLLREFCEGLDTSQEPVDLDDVLAEKLGEPPVRPLADRTPVRPRLWPAWATAVFAFTAVLLFGGVVWLLGAGRDIAPAADGGPISTEAPSTTEVPSQVAGLPDGAWSLQAAYDGWLRPVAFEGGFAAIRRLDPLSEFFAETSGDTDGLADMFTGDVSVGDIWVSSDGVDWEAAPAQPPTAPWSLTSDGETLFAEIGNVFAGTGEIWASSTGSDWRPVLTGDDYGHLFASSLVSHRWTMIPGAVAAGPPGAVVFGTDLEGGVAGWFYDGDRFEPADVEAISTLLPSDLDEIHVAALGDRFLLYTFDQTRYQSETTLKMSFSATGAAWGDPEPKPVDGPLGWPDAELNMVASTGGLNLVGMNSGFGLWATDGNSWTEITLRPAEDGWMPEVAAGELGWIVYSPPRRETAFSSMPEPGNRGLWFSPDAEVWTELDDLGPLGDAMTRNILVRDDHVLVVVGADRGEGRGWGVPEDPATEVWRLEIDQSGVNVAATSFNAGPWNPILADTSARQAPPAATCPPSAEPGRPGPSDQERPTSISHAGLTAAFDHHAGRIVYVDAAGATWTFDVCTNTWHEMHPQGTPYASERELFDAAGEPSGVIGDLVYDIDSDRTVVFGSDTVFVYDANTNTWIADPNGYDSVQDNFHPSGAVYDPVSGLIVTTTMLPDDRWDMWAYDVDTEAWTLVGTVPPERTTPCCTGTDLLGYSQQLDRLILSTYSELPDEDPPFEQVTLLLDPRTGITELLPPPGPFINLGWPGHSYGQAGGTIFVKGWPVWKSMCGFDTGTLEWTLCFDAPTGPEAGSYSGYAAMVDDPINNRLVLINGRYGDFWMETDAAVWAIDLPSGDVRTLVAPTDGP